MAGRRSIHSGGLSDASRHTLQASSGLPAVPPAQQAVVVPGGTQAGWQDRGGDQRPDPGGGHQQEPDAAIRLHRAVPVPG